jgi:plasmid stabilization system protein ParE
MVFRVEITDPARDDIDSATAYIAQDSPSAAQKWMSGLDNLIQSLEAMPERYPVIPESIGMTRSYRGAVYHSHRVIFRIDEEQNVVYVIRLYHGARRPLTDHDLAP